MRTTIGKLPWYWVLVCLIAGAAIGWWHPGETSALTAALEGRLLDLRHVLRGPLKAPDDFVIVAIDDRSVDRLQRFPVPRAALADAVDRLTDAGAKVLAIDLLLLEREAGGEGDALSSGDSLLVAALARHGHVILATTESADIPPDTELVKRSRLEVAGTASAAHERPEGSVGFRLPVSDFARVASLAHVNLPRDADRSIRRMVLAMPIGSADYLPAMPLEAVRLLRDLPRSAMKLTPGVSIALGNQQIATDTYDAIGINHYGDGGGIPSYSFIDVVEGKVPPDLLAGRAIFVGATALASGDVFLSPFAVELPGVKVLATVAANIAHGQYLLRAPSTWAIDIVVAVLLSMLAFLAANRRSLAIAAIATIALWAVTFAGLQYAFTAAYLWLDATTYVLTLFSVGILTFAARIVQQRRISGRLQSERDNLARYQSPLLAEFLAEQQSPSFHQRAQEAAVMFVDVAGFTRRAERLGPTATVVFLRELHGRIERSALAHRGVIEQFMGDGAMIIFGLPEPTPTDATRALAAARQLLDTLSDWNLDLEAAGQEPVRMRIGLHYGPVIAALLGGEHQGQITVAGDTVNVASRLQEMGKEHKAAIVASAKFIANVHRAGRDDMLSGMRRLAGQQVRGRNETIDLWVWP
ncbi:CHASE2 domain-containing protein [Dongia deserti]|uniref:CHASE2 domain-containing protein n=1 Tax=Dongia deserti TaxID=2268030 RepID=UPI000E651361|nr:adenylate/guanylate cyclase domain-containing protein [Dongia deserti]